MEYNFNQIIEELKKGFREIAKIFNNLVESITSTFISDLQEYYEKLKNRQVHKPILKLTPNKTYIRDKRIVNYYCRNNC